MNGGVSVKQVKKELPAWSDMLCRHDYVLFIWDVKSGYPKMEYVSENISVYGYSAQDYLEGKINWVDMIHEEDRSRVNREMCQFLLRASGRTLLEFRICTKTGGTVWLQADCYYMQGENSDSVYVEAVVRDISTVKEKERTLLENQISIQKEIYSYMDEAENKSLKENLANFVKGRKMEELQAVFSEVYGVHAAIIGKDYYFYTRMTGPREEAGIFYDVAELRSFHRKINTLEEILESGQRNVILSMKNPDIKITGVPIFYANEYVATWVLCCLEEKETEKLLKILEFVRIVAESLSEYWSKRTGELSARSYAFERYRLQKKIEMQEILLELYDEMLDMPYREQLLLVLKKAGEITNSTRCALYETLPSSIYARCIGSWMTENTGFNLMEREMYDVQALPDAGILLKEEPVVINSIHIPEKWNNTMTDLYASAAVLMPMEWSGKKGFLSFVEIGEERVWEEDCIWFFGEIKKIIQKVLLKSE